MAKLLRGVFGKVFGDKGYLSQELTQQLKEPLGICLGTRRRKNQDNVLMLLEDKILLRKRGLIDSVIDCLKNECQIEHTRHRSVANAFAHLIAGLVAYCHRPNKPSIQNTGLLRLAAKPTSLPVPEAHSVKAWIGAGKLLGLLQLLQEGIAGKRRGPDVEDKGG